MAIVEYLSNPNNFIAIFGIVLTFLFGIIAIYLYFRPQKEKIPCYAINNFSLVRGLVGKFNNIEMKYAGKEIENLTATKVAFWNSGKETINSSDIAPADPLEILAKDKCEILDSQIIFEKNPVNQFKIELSSDKKVLKLKFDYLDQDEGAVIQLLHTGTFSKNLEFHGSIKGVKSLLCASSTMPDNPYFIRFLSIMDFLMKYPNRRILGIIFFLVPWIFIIMVLTDLKNFNLLPDSIFVSAMLIPYWLMAYFLSKGNIPKGFDIFEEDLRDFQ